MSTSVFIDGLYGSLEWIDTFDWIIWINWDGNDVSDFMIKERHEENASILIIFRKAGNRSNSPRRFPIYFSNEAS